MIPYEGTLFRLFCSVLLRGPCFIPSFPKLLSLSLLMHLLRPSFPISPRLKSLSVSISSPQ
jgi:hypothetical protein